MPQKFSLTFLLGALFALILSAGAALAAEAKATTWLNVRSGPGTSYSVIDTMAPGETGTITECQGSWCFIQRDGPDGWVSSRYLAAAEPPKTEEPNCHVELKVDASGPHFAVVCGDESGNTLAIETPSLNRVCFYTGANFTGAHFCRSAGTYSAMPAGFDNTVSSIKVHGSARARVCERTNLKPFCRVIASDTAHLGPMLNDEISSFRVANGPLPPMKQACLFDGTFYGGAHYCVAQGTHTLPAAAQNKASSVKVYEGALARLCKSPVYCLGGAYVVTGDVPVLPPAWNNQTSSIRVE